MLPLADCDRPVTVLVTGATGFVGLNLLQVLGDAGHRVVGLANHPPPPAAAQLLRSMEAESIIEEVDVRDYVSVGEVFGRHRPDVVIHAATITAGPARERSGARKIVAVNVGGTQSVLDACSAVGVRRILYVSSGAVYGDVAFGTEVIGEETPASPTGLYGITKLTGEQLVRRHGQLHGLETLVARLSAVFGPWEYPTGYRDFMSPMLQLALAARRGETSRYVPDADRNWISSTDASTALALLALGPAPSHYCYNVCPPVRFGVGRWIEQLRLAYPAAEFVPVTGPADATITYDSDPRRQRAPVQADRLEQELGTHWWTSPDEALDRYLSWFVAQTEWLR